MPVTSGKGRLLNGSGGDRVKRNNLSEFRGSAWEAVNDWFFGVNTVDYDWRDTADKDRLTKWVYTQDGSAVSDANVVAGNKLDIGLTTGPNPSSNQRDLFTIPETGPWGIAHALVKIQSEAFAYSQSILPQHGFGLRAQEDTVRRTIAVWHDVFVGNPEVINIGVWQGNLDGTGFVNRGGNATFSLKQTYNITAGTRSGGVVTGTCSGHGMETGDWLNIDWTREFAGVSVSRSSNVVTCTPGSGHGFQAGDQVAMGLSSPASFDGTFTITSVNSTQVFWNQTGSNESGTGKLKDQASNVTQVEVTVVDANTFQYTDGKHDLTSLGVSNGNNARYFPYFMEVKVAGSMAYVRCWGRHQSIPSWTEPLHAFNVDLDKAHITYTVTASERTSSVATLTIGAHDFQLGSRIDVDITDASFDTTNGYVTGITATTVSYPNTGTNDLDGGTGTCKLQGGSALASQLVDIPTPKGSGRIALVANHEGIDAKTHCVYGDIIGTNSFESTFITVNQATETETAQPVGRAKTRTLGQAIETEIAQPIIRPGARVVASQVTGITTGATSHVIDLDELGLVDGDRVQVFAATGRNNIDPGTTWPAGWTELSDTTNIASSALTLSSAYKDISGSPPTSVTITTVNNTECQAVAQRVDGHDPATAPEVTTAIDTDNPPSITPSWGSEFGLFGTVICSEPSSATYPYSGDQQTGTGTNVEIKACTTRTTGTTIDPGSWSDIEAGLNVLTFAVRSETEGAITVNQAVETETAQPIRVVKTRAVAQATETETAQSVTRVKTLTLTQALETETATTVASSKTKALTQAVETETATTVTVVKSLAVGQAEEIESATAIARTKTLAVAQATEIETAGAIGRSKSLAVGQVAETETAQAVGRTKTRIVAQVLEVETAQVITLTTGQTVNQAIENEIAQQIRVVKSQVLGQAVETETAGAVQASKTLAIGQATETETASPVTVTKLRLLAQAVETETAQAFARIKTLAVGQAVEVETALGIALQVPDPPPASRIATIPAETRALVVEAESRSLRVGAESRTV